MPIIGDFCIEWGRFAQFGDVLTWGRFELQPISRVHIAQIGQFQYAINSSTCSCCKLPMFQGLRRNDTSKLRKYMNSYRREETMAAADDNDY